MTEENTLVAEPLEVIPADSKWGEGVSSNQSVCKVAGRVSMSLLMEVRRCC